MIESVVVRLFNQLAKAVSLLRRFQDDPDVCSFLASVHSFIYNEDKTVIDNGEAKPENTKGSAAVAANG